MKLRTLIYLYGWRLRAHPFQELLAGVGIAAGVALLFAVQVANTSVTGSVEQLYEGIGGNVELQLTAGDEHGFPASVLTRVRALDDVAVATPIIERRAVLVGPRGRQQVALVGIEPSLAQLGGRVTQNFGAGGLSIPARGVVMPTGVAGAVGAEPADEAVLLIAGRRRAIRVGATLDRGQIGVAADSPLVVTPLANAQRLSDMPGAISSIYIAARAGRKEALRRQLETLAAGRLEVGAADAPVQRLRVATEANDQSTALFSIISALVGVLFAFNAMLLTVPDRRRFVAELRTQGAGTGQVVAVLGFQAATLGVVASLAGLAFGDLLSRTVFHSVPGYLAFTFPIGTQRVVPFSAVAIAFASGLLAALLATGRPLLDAFSHGDVEAAYEEDGEPGEGISPRARRRLLGGALLLLAATAAIVTAEPSTAIFGVLALIVATLLAMPAIFAACMWLVDQVATRLNLKLLTIAVMNARATMTRSVAVAAIAAVAVLGNVAIDGARHDLVRGLHAGYADHLGTADVWITTAGRSLTTDSFALDDGTLARLAGVPGVAAVRVYQGGMFDVGSRRIWMIARPRADRVIVPPSQTLEGDAAAAGEEVRRGGAVAVSEAIAKDRGLDVGGRLTLPAPAGPLTLRVAAIVTNLSWGPGGLIVNADDYRRAWRTADPSAIELDLDPGARPAATIAAIGAALGPQAQALDVQSTAVLEAEFRSALRDGLTRLSQISTLLLVASALALGVALTASVWDRRRLLAAYKLEGVRRRQIGGMLLLEGGAVLSVGCLVGLVAGTVGHLLGDRWLELTTGFSAPFSVQLGHMTSLVVLVLALALALVSVPGFLAARVPPRLRFQE
ncbi:FtsX-like permease family protein [Conexibacter stalactiti]|uniref:FtsX-like permease family protein n=1 Tax=Conexibacter stalactiti TaxID=1940611 RepID=A0ABU4HW85_9ACTN|nr:FtsX-like permease family protein [Conexibacter stalactiti]MDW5597493.1 FtsX-like permease family protein [Conexibacter stalactiti]MEC5038135.1 FtsX-like permease family protein [Conexibacter stalactiti]